ncbi:MAG TPA: cell division protein FtsA, partial [Exiguobacterium sp.]|nr:cell division protein FtsA [Exiguobacterium sp.]
VASGREQDALLMNEQASPAREERLTREQPPKEKKSFSSFFEKFFG